MPTTPSYESLRKTYEQMSLNNDTPDTIITTKTNLVAILKLSDWTDAQIDKAIQVIESGKVLTEELQAQILAGEI